MKGGQPRLFTSVPTLFPCALSPSASLPHLSPGAVATDRVGVDGVVGSGRRGLSHPGVLQDVWCVPERVSAGGHQCGPVLRGAAASHRAGG